MNVIIPPAIIHTAVENGVTHGLPLEDGTITFRLSFETTSIYRQYTLQTIADKRPSGNLVQRGASGEGTGTRYIKSRLQESYQDRWVLISRPTEQGWEMIVQIYDVTPF